MELTYILLGSAAAALLLLSMFMLRGSALTPVRSREDTTVTVVIDAKNSAFELENLLAGLCWLRENGLLYADVIICDRGLCSSGMRRAQLLCQRYDRLTVHLCDNLEEMETHNDDDG